MKVRLAHWYASIRVIWERLKGGLQVEEAASKEMARSVLKPRDVPTLITSKPASVIMP